MTCVKARSETVGLLLPLRAPRNSLTVFVACLSRKNTIHVDYTRYEKQCVLAAFLAYHCPGVTCFSLSRLYWTTRTQVRIYDPVKAKFVIITVDDRIPCKKGTKKPRFMSPNGNELWAIILEKAYAKFCGSYAKLSGGMVLWGWLSMTGDNVFQMSINDNKNQWIREDMVAIKDKNDKRACGFRKTKEKYSNDNLWTLLKKYDKQKALISASIGKMDYRKTDGPSGEQMLEREGLVAGHAYSVLQAREVSENFDLTGGGEKFRLLQIRNPWGTFEWKGSWSDKSSKWKKYPKIKKQVNKRLDESGVQYF